MTNPEHDDSTAARLRAVVVAGHQGDVACVVDALDSDEPQVRAAALGATVRLASSASAPLDARTVAAPSTAATAALLKGLHDADAAVRRRAAVEIGRWSSAEPGPTVRDTELLAEALIERLALPDEAPVCEVAAFACGELRLSDDAEAETEAGPKAEAETEAADRQDQLATIDPAITARVVAALVDQATGHDDHLCRESAVAALGSIGDPDGLPAVLAGCQDRATVRRRAVLALAAFDDPRATDALTLLVTDRDLQVRQAAEELLAIEGGELT